MDQQRKNKTYVPFIVTVFDMKDLDSLYEDLETEGKTPQNISILRKVECTKRRTISRSTHYLLSFSEAAELKKDPRIRSIEPDPIIRGMKPQLYASEQESNHWDKSQLTQSNMLNWGLLRCYEGQNRPNWGTDDNGQNSSPSYLAQVYGKINLTQTGKNVDVVIVDDNGIVWNHPEFKNAQGENRTVQYNWGQHNQELGIGPNQPYVYGQPALHSTHVTGTACGKTQGWARDANIYNTDYSNDAVCIDYVRAFHNNKPINPATGRKNPTIVNNSWGYSIPYNYWQWDQITAVTYRGVRYTPNGPTIRKGQYGIETYGKTIGNFINLENGGNRILLGTTNIIDPETGLIPLPTFVSHPITISWAPEGLELWSELFGTADYFWLNINDQNWQEYLTNSQIFEVVYQGSGILEVSWDLAIDIAFVGTAWAWLKLTSKITVLDDNDNIIKEIIKSQNSGVGIQTNVEINIWEYITLDNNVNYTLRFEKIITKNVPLECSATVYDSISVSPSYFQVPAASVSSIPLILLGPQNLTVSTEPDFGTNDDGSWTIYSPFTITLPDGEITNQIDIDIGGWINVGTYPGVRFYFAYRPGVFVFEDNSIQRIYYGTENTAPNRTFRIRIEATTSSEGVLGSPDLLYEITFYENLPNKIDFHVGQNSDKIIGGLFDFDQLLEWGLQQFNGIPVRVDALDSDIEAAMQDGIIFVGSAGNDSWKIAVPGDIDWDNSFEMADSYPWSVDYPIYYMRGSSPTANDNLLSGNYDIPNICVGAAEFTAIDRKAAYSNCGPGVDLYAPGTFIISSTPDVIQFGNLVSKPYPGDPLYQLYKLTGTSMASPQVTGILACALEIYPNMNQVEAKNYILSYAKNNQLTIGNLSPIDYSDTQGSANKFLYYKKERETTGNNFPKLNYKPRPGFGFVYPRTRIRRK